MATIKVYFFYIYTNFIKFSLLLFSVYTEISFLCLFITEMSIKYYALGNIVYFRSSFNKFDCFVSITTSQPLFYPLFFHIIFLLLLLIIGNFRQRFRNYCYRFLPGCLIRHLSPQISTSTPRIQSHTVSQPAKISLL